MVEVTNGRLGDAERDYKISIRDLDADLDLKELRVCYK
jgi:hypothetical protein